MTLMRRGSKQPGKRKYSTGLQKDKKVQDKTTPQPSSRGVKKSINIDDRWIIVELRESASLEEDHEIIESHILEAFGSSTQYFLPIYKERFRDGSAVILLFDGYFFLQIQDIFEERINRFRNEYIKGPLYVNGKYSYVTDADIEKFKNQLKKKIKDMIPHKGDAVVPKVGIFNNLKGKVIKIDRKNFIAHVEFRSATRVVEAPISIINLRNGDRFK